MASWFSFVKALAAPGGRRVETRRGAARAAEEARYGAARRGSAAAIVATAMLLASVFALGGCDLDDDDDLSLVGTWKASGEGWTDTYVITAGTLDHENNIAGDIAYVYNFSDTAGCLILKLTRKVDLYEYGPAPDYTATNKGKPAGDYWPVYYKDLTSNTVRLGDGYSLTEPDISAATLEEAKEKFAPANVELYGGGSAMTGTPQTRQ